MTPVEITLLAAVVLLVGATAYLAAAETVLARLDVVRALRLAEEGVAGSAPLLWLTQRRATTSNVLLAVGTVVRVALVALATVLVLRLDAGGAALVLVLVALALVVLVSAEIAPRTLVLRNLEAAGVRLAASVRILVMALDPLVRVVVSIGRALVRGRGEVSGPFASDDELRAMEVDDGEHDELEPEERAMIRSIFELASTLAREVMTPRPDMVTVAADAPLREVVDVVLEHGTSRLPVHDPDDPDRVVGVVHAKDLLQHLAAAAQAPAASAGTGPGGVAPAGSAREGAAGAGGSWHELLREPMFVPETKRCDDLLRDLRAAAIHLAVVVDEHGELVGLVTIEDILEEIVGEIVDEHDHEEPLVVATEDGALRIDARLGVDDLNELLGTALPEEGWDTVGGLVYATLGRIPTPGESIELDGTAIVVEEVNGRRIGKVLVSHRAAGEGEAVDGGDADGDVRGDSRTRTSHLTHEQGARR